MKKIISLICLLCASAGLKAQYVYANITAASPGVYDGCGVVYASGMLINQTPDVIMGGTAYLQKLQPDNTWTTVPNTQKTVTNGMISGLWSILSSGTYRANASLYKVVNGVQQPMPVQPNQPSGLYFTVYPTATANFNIHGNTSTYPTQINSYANATVINFNNQSTNASEYDLDVIRTDVNGNTITIIANGSWTPSLTTVNLVSYTSSQILVPGYYKVELSVRNSNCPTPNKRTAFIKMNPPLDFRFFASSASSPNTIPRSTNPAAPSIIGYYSCGIESFTNTGALSVNRYRVIIERVSPTPGIITTTPSGWVNASVLPGSIPFNSWTNGYFGANFNSLDGILYKVTVDIEGGTGNLSVFSYFAFQDGVFRLANPKTWEVSTASTISIWPNPVGDWLNVGIPESLRQPGNGWIEVWDIQGRKLHTTGISGNAAEKINVADFPAGVYLLKIGCNGTTLTERFVK